MLDSCAVCSSVSTGASARACAAIYGNVLHWISVFYPTAGPEYGAESAGDDRRYDRLDGVVRVASRVIGLPVPPEDLPPIYRDYVAGPGKAEWREGVRNRRHGKAHAARGE